MTYVEAVAAYVAGTRKESHELAPARGVVVGLGICLPFWALAGLCWWLA